MSDALALVDALARAHSLALARAHSHARALADAYFREDARALARLDARVLADARARVLASLDARALIAPPDAITITYSEPEAAQVAAALERYHGDLEQRIHHLVRTLPPGDDTWAVEKDAQGHTHAALVKTRQALRGSR